MLLVTRHASILICLATSVLGVGPSRHPPQAPEGWHRSNTQQTAATNRQETLSSPQRGGQEQGSGHAASSSRQSTPAPRTATGGQATQRQWRDATSSMQGTRNPLLSEPLRQRRDQQRTQHDENPAPSRERRNGQPSERRVQNTARNPLLGRNNETEATRSQTRNPLLASSRRINPTSPARQGVATDRTSDAHTAHAGAAPRPAHNGLDPFHGIPWPTVEQRRPNRAGGFNARATPSSAAAARAHPQSPVNDVVARSQSIDPAPQRGRSSNWYDAQHLPITAHRFTPGPQRAPPALSTLESVPGGFRVVPPAAHPPSQPPTRRGTTSAPIPVGPMQGLNRSLLSAHHGPYDSFGNSPFHSAGSSLSGSVDEPMGYRTHSGVDMMTRHTELMGRLETLQHGINRLPQGGGHGAGSSSGGGGVGNGAGGSDGGPSGAHGSSDGYAGMLGGGGWASAGGGSSRGVQATRRRAPESVADRSDSAMDMELTRGW